MANLILRTLTRPGDTTKSSPLTNAEVDQNFINIDADLETKAPLNGAVMTNIDINSGSIDGTSVGAASASTGRFTSVGVTDTTASTSTTTGALTVAGGVGVAGKINTTDLQVTNTITGSVSGNAASATQLQTARTINGTSFNGAANITTTNWGTARTISYTGDVTGSASVNGSADVSFAMTLANSGATAGTYAKVTVNAKGLVTAGSSLVAADIPSLDASKITSGTFDVARIPTGISITGNASTATTLSTARTINGTSFNGSANITTANWGTARDVTIGNTTKSVNGSAAVSWSLAEIGAASITGTETLTNKTIVSSTLVDGRLAGYTNYDIVEVPGLDINCSLGNYFTKTINANSTFIMSNVPPGAYGFMLELTHISGTVTWPASVRWPDGVVPELVAGKTHIFAFVTDNSGTTWFGNAAANYS